MRTITSLLFALNADQATRFKHYVRDDSGKYDIAQVCLNVPVTTRCEGRFECLLENMEITEDAITKNMVITLHLLDKDGLKEAMIKDDRIFTFDMKYSPRTQKMNLSVFYDGFKP